ncbi:MAG: terminase small subunit [Ignavibacteriaceae bacterium]
MVENSQKKLKLTKRQEMLCRNYAQNGHNGSAAAIEAGYSKKYARTIACLIFKKPHVLEYLDELEQPVKEKLRVTENWVITLLKNICDANITDYYDIDPKTNKVHLKDLKKLPREKTCAIESIRSTRSGPAITLIDKIACLMGIGKYLGMFKDQYRLNVNNNLINAEIKIPGFDSIENAEDTTNEIGEN